MVDSCYLRGDGRNLLGKLWTSDGMESMQRIFPGPASASDWRISMFVCAHTIIPLHSNNFEVIQYQNFLTDGISVASKNTKPVLIYKQR